MKLAVAEATACTCDLVYYVVCIGTRATVASRDRKDSKDTQLARREHAVYLRDDPVPKTALYEHTHTRMRDMETWEKHTRLRCSDQCSRAGRQCRAARV